MDKHNLHDYFPEFSDRIHELKMNDNHFRKLFEDYNDLNKDIHRIESSEIYTDSELNNLRSRRVLLKDEIFSYLDTHDNI